jgi:hypothetical protein
LEKVLKKYQVRNNTLPLGERSQASPDKLPLGERSQASPDKK